jgi:hypothetical protein
MKKTSEPAFQAKVDKILLDLEPIKVEVEQELKTFVDSQLPLALSEAPPAAPVAPSTKKGAPKSNE